MAETGRRQANGPPLSPATTAGLVTIALLVVAGVSAFAMLGLAGPFGRLLAPALRALFGAGAWLFPATLTVVAALRLQEVPRRATVSVGLSLGALAVLALVDMLQPLEALDRSAEGGGYVGLFLRFPLETVFGYWASWLILTGVALGAALVTFDASLQAVLQPVRAALRWLAAAAAEFIRGAASSARRPEPPVLFTVGRLPEGEPDRREAAGGPASVGQLPLPVVAGAAEGRRGSPATTRYRSSPIDLPLSLLTAAGGRPSSGDVREKKLLIQKTLESFGIPVEMGEANVGPTVTQYTLKPEDGVKLAAITALSNDLALALAAHPIRIEAPIPGRSLVGIEVPNEAVATVPLREILESEAFVKRRSNLMLALGKDVAGSPWVVDLERMPHILVAGATGSGKSVCLNAIILSLVYENSPADLRFVMVDPKRVEFQIYQHLPHLLTPVITEVPATVNALKWLLKEMDRRFTLLAAAGDRNIQSYSRHAPEKLPYLVLVIDELADLMVAAASEVEAAIIRLAQMSRAVGIHLVLATQRPSVDVITGLIKANITARVAFAVASLMDSRTILDAAGAEKLIGRGDLLFVSSEVPKPKRLQGAFVADDEIRRVVDFLKSKAVPEYVGEVTAKQPGPGYSGGSDDDGDDPLLGEAQAVIVQAGKASASLLQRRLKVGYARAARILDLLEARGVIGPGDGAKPRDVLIEQVGRDMLSEMSDGPDDITTDHDD